MSLYFTLNVVVSVVMNLTATKVKNIKKAGRYTDLNGLALLVTKTISKSWVYRYQIGGKRRDMGLGKYPAISLAQARELRDDASKLIASGIDPIDHRNTKKDSILKTFEQLASEFIEFKSVDWKNVKHKQQWHSTLKTYAYPFIGHLEANQIDTRAIKSMLKPIWSEIPETATRVRSRVENIIDYAIAMGESDKANPASLKVISKVLPANSKSKRIKHHPSLDYKLLPEFWRELEQHQSVNANCLRLAILTATRTNEVIAANLSEIEGNVWTLSPERMKMQKEHRIPLCNYIVDLIDNLPTVNGFLFPSSRLKNDHVSNMAMLNLVKKTMKKDFTVHGFRATFKTWASEETNYDVGIVEAALAHTIKNKVEAAYNRGDLLEKRRGLMNEWCDFVVGNK